ncbi:S-locus lectin kinase family protein, putative [Medicago truncatula]|uniref:S-locus lectin kinase family protein, putative n=1 Tax=Medicago truncatula TaxID=3880 RepID=A0A072UA33_MEDTR|nr:S-locus lectin kinase family protein, putative [Medicago truncatula]
MAFVGHLQRKYAAAYVCIIAPALRIVTTLRLAGNLFDIEQLESGGLDLYFRVAHTELVEPQKFIPSDDIIGKLSQAKLQELLLFGFRKLKIATKNFALSNKLGESGFGLVYKGKLQDGHEIAVKTLSRVSGKGLEEFMNELVVLCKL